MLAKPSSSVLAKLKRRLSEARALLAASGSRDGVALVSVGRAVVVVSKAGTALVVAT